MESRLLRAQVRRVIERTISRAAAMRFYDRLGAGHDRAEFYERKAKERALALLGLRRGERLLNVGAGTGLDHFVLLEQAGSEGLAVVLDLSPVMLRLARRRTGAPCVRAEATVLPFADETFDGLFCTYVLDLLPAEDLGPALREFRRVLRPGGRLAVVSLTEGVSASSRALIRIWKWIYRLRPTALGGCRPLRLASHVEAARFRGVAREVVVQRGVPSEVVIGRKPARRLIRV